MWVRHTCRIVGVEPLEILAVLVLLGALSWQPVAETQGRGGVLRIGMTASDIAYTAGQLDQGFEGFRFVGYQLYEALVRWALSQGERLPDIAPALAESWEVDKNDVHRWVFTLRRGVKFHDGSDFNADAVIWNWDKIRNKEAPQYDTKQAGEVAQRITAMFKAFCRQVQMVFQDPYSSLNPRMNIEDAVAFNARAHGDSRTAARSKAWAVLQKVGLRPEQFGRRYPHELSGGQRQRVNIARALILDPRLVILDEPVSSLDKSVQAQVLNLLQTLKNDLGLTYLFISHDLHVIEYLSDRVLVMYLGQIMEMGSAADVSTAPLHPYTQALFASAPSMNPDERLDHPPLLGDPPNPINPPSGCRFRTRCPHAMEQCAATSPPLLQVGSHDRYVACYLYSDQTASHSALSRPA